MAHHIAVTEQGRLTRVIPLVGPVCTIGSGTDNHLVLPDRNIHEIHLRLREETFGWVVEDLGGSLINGERRKNHVLAGGDQIQLGRTVLQYVVEPATGKEPVARESVERLHHLFEAAGSLEAGSAEDVLGDALRELRAIFDVERSLVLLRADAKGELVPVLSDGLEGRAEDQAISLSVARDVDASGIALLVPDASSDARYAAAASVVRHEIRTVLCCPIAYRNQKLGVLYLDGRSPSRSFGPRDLAALELFSKHAARALREGRDRLALTTMASRYRALARESVEQAGSLGSLPARSEVMRHVLEVVSSAATKDVSILFTGESGAGKDVLARAVHLESPRHAGPFVAVNLAALPRDLVESELFGHEKGAFSGAAEARAGRMELAEGGTLFLDEIGEVDLAVQVKLLRVLQDRRFERLGGTATREVDVRFVFATNADLKERVRLGAFRADLFYRISTFPVRVPALRERIEDLPLLAEQILADCSKRFGKTIRGIEPAAIELLAAYPWPGNVRELKNVIERAAVLETGSELKAQTLRRGLDPLDAAPAASSAEPMEEYPATFEAARVEFERRWLTHQLKKFGGNISKTARHIGLSRVSVHRKMLEMGIKE